MLLIIARLLITKMRANSSPILRSTLASLVSRRNSCRGTVIKFSVVFRSASSPNREAAIILAPRFASSIIRRWGASQRQRAPTSARERGGERERERVRTRTGTQRLRTKPAANDSSNFRKLLWDARLWHPLQATRASRREFIRPDARPRTRFSLARDSRNRSILRVYGSN